jgi:hypothetical protein
MTVLTAYIADVIKEFNTEGAHVAGLEWLRDMLEGLWIDSEAMPSWIPS